MKRKNNNINFFGVKTIKKNHSKSYTGTPNISRTQPIKFLGAPLSTKKVPKSPFIISNKQRPTNFLGKVPRKVDYLGFKGPYGDKDMDGSPNKWDCSPNQVNKDGIMGRLLNVATFGRLGQSKEDYTKEKKERYEGFIYPRAKVQDPRQFEVIKEKYGNPSPRQQRYNKFMAVMSKLDPKGYNKKLEKVERMLGQRSAAGISSALRDRQVKAYLETLPQQLSKDEVKMREIEYRNKLKREAQQESAGGFTKDQQEVRKLQDKLLLEKVKAMTKGLKGDRKPSHPYAKQYKIISQFMPGVSPANTGVSETTSGGYIRKGGKKGSKGGRPFGTYSAKHVIPGKGPVHVYEWRKWVRAQRRAQKMAMQQQAYQGQNIEQNYQKEFSSQPQGPQQQYQPQYQPQPEYQPNQFSYRTEDQPKYESELPEDNKFVRRMQFEQGGYMEQHYNRLKNEQPKGFVQRLVQMKREAMQKERDFARRTNILRAHEHMLTPQENAINFLDTNDNLLDSRGNNIMQRRPDSIDVLRTGRPNVLQSQGFYNADDMNPLRAQNLNFGKVNTSNENPQY